MVANHQSSEHQGRMNRPDMHATNLVPRVTLLRCIIFSGRESEKGQNEPTKHVRIGGSCLRKRP
jgi:hypothetical protein